MQIKLSRSQWEAAGKKAGWIKEATGEPDQDYDHDIYDAIINLIKKETGINASHREFDKYQGVYIFVPKNLKFWTVDSFHVGKQKATAAKYDSASLITPDGEETSATRGDYFAFPSEKVLDGYTLILTELNGEKKKIVNPKVIDLPDLLDVKKYVEYEAEPNSVLVLQEESGQEKFNVVISPDNKIISDGGLISYITNINKNHNS